MNLATFARNATACENAKHPTCRCACGGALHGIKHSREWIEQTWAELETERLETLELERLQLSLPLSREASRDCA